MKPSIAALNGPPPEAKRKNTYRDGVIGVITPAASVLLSRGPAREVYAILRDQQLRFFGGFWAFPGGKLTELATTTDHLESASRCVPWCSKKPASYCAPQIDGALPDIGNDINEARQLLLDERLPFEQFLSDQGCASSPMIFG